MGSRLTPDTGGRESAHASREDPLSLSGRVRVRQFHGRRPLADELRDLSAEARSHRLGGEAARIAYYEFLPFLPAILLVLAVTGSVGGDLAFDRLSGVVALQVWLFLTALGVLLGAEIAAALERRCDGNGAQSTTRAATDRAASATAAGAIMNS